MSDDAAKIVSQIKRMGETAFLNAVAPAAKQLISTAQARVITAPVPSMLRPWSEVLALPDANNLETLTYVPGLVGDVVEWIVSGARRPNRVMAMGVASAVIGTLIGHRIEGPTESATHLYIIILGPTGFGKDWPMKAGTALVDAVGRQDLLGPNEWASSPGFQNLLKRKPIMICFVDELGDELNKINGKNANVYVANITALLKRCYNAWEVVMTGEKVKEEMERIDWPAPSIVGAATPEKFFGSLQPGDLESGFANRLLILPFEGHRKAPEQSPAPGSKEVPPHLIAALKALPKRIEPGKDEILNAPADGSIRPKPPLIRIGWGPGAEDVYFKFSRKIDTLESGDSQRYELSMRACENAVRLATNIAVGRGSPTVDCEDIAWGIAWAEQSLEAACGGVARYMRQYFDFPKFCEEVLGYVEAEGGWASRYNIERKFRGNLRNGFDMQNVLGQLLREKRIEKADRAGTRGPAAEGFRIIGDDEKVE